MASSVETVSKIKMQSSKYDRFLKVQTWQVDEIKKGINEADAGKLIAHDKVVKYWKRRQKNSIG